MKTGKSFASDNNSGVHPQIIAGMMKANEGHTLAYGGDHYTQQAIDIFRDVFGKSVEVFFVLTGTGANVLSLQSVTKSYHSVICAASSHMQVDECGAPEKFTGCKLLPVETTDGKLTPERIQKHLHGFGFEHHAQPKIISITQATELGTVYSLEEIRQIADLAHQKELFVHMDGARISNAAAYLNVGLKELVVDTGIDVLSFGGTKNGMMYGEAILFLNPSLAEDFKYFRKQSMQLISKMRYVAAQFIVYLTDDLWLHNAMHANAMAQLLKEKLLPLRELTITREVQSNAVFVIMPRDKIPLIQGEHFFYVWNEETGEVRMMTSYDTDEEDVEDFVRIIKKHLK